MTAPVERPLCEQCEKYRARIHELAGDGQRDMAMANRYARQLREERDAAIRALGTANRPLAAATHRMEEP